MWRAQRGGDVTRPPVSESASSFGEPVSPPHRTRTPPDLARRILASRSALEGERKTVTALFCDIVDSTGTAERIGDEAMAALVEEFFIRSLAEVHRYEGIVTQFLGDGFLALFGAPLTHEDHAHRAVLAAWGIASALHASPIPIPAADRALEVRIGLNSGEVVVGRIGDSLRWSSRPSATPSTSPRVFRPKPSPTRSS